MRQDVLGKLGHELAGHNGLLYSDGRLLENLLGDLYGGGQNKEILILSAAVHAGVAEDFKRLSSAPILGPLELHLARAKAKILAEVPLDESSADHSVETWARLTGLLPWKKKIAQAASEFSGPSDVLKVNKKDRSCFRSINEAIEASPPFGKITLAPGYYYEDLVVEKPISIAADIAGAERVIFGSHAIGSGALYADEIKFLSGSLLKKENRTVVKVVGGHLALQNCKVFKLRKAGRLLEATDSIVSCRSTHFSGGNVGVLVQGESELHLDNVSIMDSRMVSTWIRYQARAYLTRCKIYRNKGTGLCASQGGYLHMHNCEISANKGSGVEIGSSTRLHLEASQVQQNNGIGVIAYPESNGCIKGCSVWGNSIGNLDITPATNWDVRDCQVG